MGTVSVLGLRFHQILEVESLVNITKRANFSGTAKAMEGEGTDRICHRLKEA